MGSAGEDGQRQADSPAREMDDASGHGRVTSRRTSV